MSNFRSLPRLAAAMGINVDSYSVQDQEDSTGYDSGLTFDQALDMVYSFKGTYAVTNERTGTVSYYTYS